jgi:hypothetical protein
VSGHEVDGLRGCELRRNGEVALVLAVGRVDDDHELALADVLDRLFDRGEGARLRNDGAFGCHCVKS